MRVVISVVGKDTVGILAHVSTKCMNYEANIVDVSLKVLQDFYTMVMIVEWQTDLDRYHAFINEMENYGSSQGLKIYVMHEDIFQSMHSI